MIVFVCISVHGGLVGSIVVVYVSSVDVRIDLTSGKPVLSRQNNQCMNQQLL